MTAAPTLESIKARCFIDGDCWVWTGACCHGTPYIATRIDGRRVNVNVQKLALALAGVKVPPGGKIRESCGNQMCVNPEHLEQAGFFPALKFKGNPFAQLLARA